MKWSQGQPMNSPRASFIDHILSAARKHLSMDVAYVTELTGHEQVVRVTVGDAPTLDLEAGMRLPVEDTYCQLVVGGELANPVADTATNVLTQEVAARTDLGISSYIGVPVRLSNGQTYGTLCCASGEPVQGLDYRDVQFLQVLAQLIADEIEDDERLHSDLGVFREQIRDVLDKRDLQIVFQPIIELATGETVGVEALSRFPGESSPSVWFGSASRLGLGPDLERAAARAAISHLSLLGEDLYLSLNASPELLLTGWIDDLFVEAPADRIVIELSEHAEVEDYTQLNEALEPAIERGVRLAIDDAGAGFIGYRHLVQLSPEIIKLDISLTRGIGLDPIQNALAAGITSFASTAGMTVIAEGIEQSGTVEILRELGVEFGQGRHFSPPVTLSE